MKADSGVGEGGLTAVSSTVHPAAGSSLSDPDQTCSGTFSSDITYYNNILQ